MTHVHDELCVGSLGQAICPQLIKEEVAALPKSRKLTTLADRVEVSTWREADREELGVEINEALGIAGYITDDGDPTQSVDAALTLIPTGFDYMLSREAGAHCVLLHPNGADAFHPRAVSSTRARTAPLTICVAALRLQAILSEDAA
jgi:hypothetical protein